MPNLNDGHTGSGMTEARKKAFDLAAEAAKQILTLSVAVITFSVTFLKDIFQIQSHPVPNFAYGVLVSAWVLFILSSVAGIYTLYGLCARALDPDPELLESAAQTAAKWQMVLFLLALAAISAFGVMLVKHR